MFASSGNVAVTPSLGHNEKRPGRRDRLARAPVAAVDWLGVLPRPSTLRCALEGAPLSYCHLYWIFALDHLLSVVP